MKPARVIQVVFVAALTCMAVVACTGGGDRQSVCRGYITCYEATGGIKGSLDPVYGSAGSCSSSGVDCEAVCRMKLDALKAAFPDAGCTG